MINLIEKEILFDILNNPNDTFYENVLSDFLNEQGVEHDFRKPLHNNFIAELKSYQEKCLDIWAKQWSRVKDQVRGQVKDLVKDRIWNRGINMVGNAIWYRVSYGQKDAYWFSYYAYMMQVLRVEAPKLFVPYMLLAQEVNWWCPTEQTVFVTRKPKECIIEDGKLVKLIYQDGYTIT